MILHEYDLCWSLEFRRLNEAYRVVLGNLLCRAEHVGSTSIHGIAAKPIIDIDLVIFARSDFPIVRVTCSPF